MSKPPGPPSRVLVKIRVVIPVVSSSKIVGPASSAVEFTTQPRFSAGSQPRSSRLSWRGDTNRSAPPHPPPPVLWEGSGEHTSELQARSDLVCRALLE